jgi:hypothetical protein
VKLSDFHRRDDLCKKGQSALYYLADYGAIIKVGKGWWATNDRRWELVGVKPNQELFQPTLGPLKSAKEAAVAFAKAKEKFHAPKEPG